MFGMQTIKVTGNVDKT